MEENTEERQKLQEIAMAAYFCLHWKTQESSKGNRKREEFLKSAAR
jgi:hypothetical protein